MDVGKANKQQETNPTTLITQTANTINTVNNLLDLQVEDYDHMQSYFSSNEAINYQNLANTNSSRYVDGLDKKSPKHLLDLMSDSDTTRHHFRITDEVYSVSF